MQCKIQIPDRGQSLKVTQMRILVLVCKACKFKVENSEELSIKLRLSRPKRITCAVRARPSALSTSREYCIDNSIITGASLLLRYFIDTSIELRARATLNVRARMLKYEDVCNCNFKIGPRY